MMRGQPPLMSIFLNWHGAADMHTYTSYVTPHTLTHTLIHVHTMPCIIYIPVYTHRQQLLPLENIHTNNYANACVYLKCHVHVLHDCKTHVVTLTLTYPG